MQTVVVKWQSLTDQEKQDWKNTSREEFVAQKAAAIALGIKVRTHTGIGVACPPCGIDGACPPCGLPVPATDTHESPPHPLPGPGMEIKGKHPEEGPYSLLSLLGEGSYGRVFMARHTRTACKVALKVFADPECHTTLNEIRMYHLIGQWLVQTCGRLPFFHAVLLDSRPFALALALPLFFWELGQPCLCPKNTQ